MFLSIDGIDGAGKSTQLQRLSQWLSEKGCDVATCRDPGSTPLGEELRQLVLSRSDLPIHRRSELLLYMAARAQLVEEVIRPALEKGQVVVSDRFLLANVAYQGYGGGLDVEQAWQIGHFATSGIEPQLVLVLDLEVDEALARVGRSPDRMEGRGLAFFQRVRHGFLQEAQLQPHRVRIIPAAGSVDEVEREIRRHVQPLLDAAQPVVEP